MPKPLTMGELEVGGMLDAGGVLDVGGLLDAGGALETGGTLLSGGVEETEEPSVPEDSGEEESREEAPEVSLLTEPVLPIKMISPIKSKNSTPTVTISMIARLSLWRQVPPQMGHRRRY